MTYKLLTGVLLIVVDEKLCVMAAAGVMFVKKQSVARRLTRLSCATAGACLVVLSLIVPTLTFNKL